MLKTSKAHLCQVIDVDIFDVAAIAIFARPDEERGGLSWRRFALPSECLGMRNEADMLFDFCVNEAMELPSPDAVLPEFSAASDAEFLERREFVKAQYTARGINLSDPIDFPEKSIDLQTRAEVDYYQHIATLRDTGNFDEGDLIAPSPSTDRENLPVSITKFVPFDPFQTEDAIATLTSMVFAEVVNRETETPSRGISIIKTDHFWKKHPGYVETHLEYFTNEVRDYKSKFKKFTLRQTGIGFSIGVGGVPGPNLSNALDIKFDAKVFEKGKPKKPKKPEKEGNKPDKEASSESLVNSVSFGGQYASKKARLIEQEISEYRSTIGVLLSRRVAKIGKEPKWDTDVERLAE